MNIILSPGCNPLLRQNHRDYGLRSSGFRRTLAEPSVPETVMETPDSPAPEAPVPKGQYPSTHWSVISDARSDNSLEASLAFARLYETYKPALLAFLRRLGNPRDKAEELLDGFFAKLLDKHSLRKVDREKGHFRNWLIATIKRHTQDCHQKEKAARRDPGIQPIPIGDSNDSGCVQPVASTRTPDQEYDREFAIAFLGHVMKLLEAEFILGGKKPIFDALVPFLQDRKPGPSHAEVGKSLVMKVAAVSQVIHRMRRRYRELFHEELSKLCGPGQVEEERRSLFAALENVGFHFILGFGDDFFDAGWVNASIGDQLL